MALPQTVDSGTRTGAANTGPFLYGGNTYVVLIDQPAGTGTAYELKALKTTDAGTASWVEQDASNKPGLTTSTTGQNYMDGVVDGSDIHVVSYNSDEAALKYHRFDMSTDTWEVADNEIADLSGMSVPTEPNVHCAIGGSGSGDIVVFAQGLSDANMSTAYQRADMWRRSKTATTGAWTGPTSIGSTTSNVNEYVGDLVSGTSGGVHFLWSESEAAATNRDDIRARTANSSYSLSTTQTYTLSAPETTLRSFIKAVTYDDSGTQRVVLINIAPVSAHEVDAAEFAEDGSGNAGAFTYYADKQTDLGTQTIGLSSGGIRATLLPVGTTVYMFYMGDTASTTPDIFYSTTTDRGSTFATATLLFDGPWADFEYTAISVASQDASTLGFIYNNDGPTVYNELSLGNTLTADTQTYTLTGVAANLNRGYVLTADQQTYTLTGVAANLNYGYVLPADTQTYTLTGVAAGLPLGYHIFADLQTYALTGVAADLDRALVLPADQQTYTLTGIAANLNRGLVLPVDQQTYTLTGVAANLNRGYTLTADTPRKDNRSWRPPIFGPLWGWPYCSHGI